MVQVDSLINIKIAFSNLTPLGVNNTLSNYIKSVGILCEILVEPGVAKEDCQPIGPP